MDHLQQAQYAIHRAVEATDKANTTHRERAALETQIATAYALIALVERMDEMAKTQALALEHSEDLYALPSN